MPKVVCALIVVVPSARICAVPCVGSIAMTLGSLDVQVADTVAPLAVALNWIVWPWLADKL